MKKLIALFAVVLSTAAFARETVSFSYSGFENWGTSYFHCDYVEARTEKVLAMFGATEVSVRCNGGIEVGSGWWSPVSVKASFEAPVLAGNEAPQTVSYRGEMRDSSCGLNVAIVNALLPKFSNVKVMKKSDSCAFASSNFSYVFSIMK